MKRSNKDLESIDYEVSQILSNNQSTYDQVGENVLRAMSADNAHILDNAHKFYKSEHELQELFMHDKNGKIIPPTYEYVKKISDLYGGDFVDLKAAYDKVLNDYIAIGTSVKDEQQFYAIVAAYFNDVSVFIKGQRNKIHEAINQYSYLPWATQVGKFSDTDLTAFYDTLNKYSKDIQATIRANAPSDIPAKSDQPDITIKLPPANVPDGSSSDFAKDFLGGVWLGFTHGAGIIVHLLEGDVSSYVADISNPNNPKAKDPFGLGDAFKYSEDFFKNITGIDPQLIIYGLMALGGLIIYNQVKPLISSNKTEY